MSVFFIKLQHFPIQFCILEPNFCRTFGLVIFYYRTGTDFASQVRWSYSVWERLPRAYTTRDNVLCVYITQGCTTCDNVLCVYITRACSCLPARGLSPCRACSSMVGTCTGVPCTNHTENIINIK